MFMQSRTTLKTGQLLFQKKAVIQESTTAVRYRYLQDHFAVSLSLPVQHVFDRLNKFTALHFIVNDSLL